MVKGQRGPKVNPLLKIETTLKVFVARSLAKLGLESVGDVGHPRDGFGSVGFDDEDE